MDYSLPGFSVHGILHARILVYIAIPFSRGSSCPKDPNWVSCIEGRLFTIWATWETHGYKGNPPIRVISLRKRKSTRSLHAFRFREHLGGFRDDECSIWSFEASICLILWEFYLESWGRGEESVSSFHSISRSEGQPPPSLIPSPFSHPTGPCIRRPRISEPFSPALRWVTGRHPTGIPVSVTRLSLSLASAGWEEQL